MLRKLRHNPAAIFRIAETLDSIIQIADRRSKPALVQKYDAHAVLIQGDIVRIIGRAPQLKRIHKGIHCLVILRRLRVCLA